MAFDKVARIDAGTKIVITGANGLVGQALLNRLRSTSARTVALIRYGTELPANEVIPGPLTSPSAVEALKKADCVVHLAGAVSPFGKNSYQEANVETTEAVVHALRGGKANRVLYLSHVNAHEESMNLYLKTKGIAENLLKASGKQAVIFRCTHMIGSPETPGPLAHSMVAKPGKKKAGLFGNGRQRVAPLYVGDAVAALMAALEGGRAGVYDLAGPEMMSMEDLARLLNRDPEVRISPSPNWVARLLSKVFPMMQPAFVDLMLQDSLGDSSRAISAFGLKLTSLRTIWR